MAQNGNMSEYHQKRRAMGAVLAAAAVCAVIIVAAIGTHAITLSQLSASALSQQTASELSTPTNTNKTNKDQKTTDKVVAVPQLVSYLRQSRPAVMSTLGPGATVTTTHTVTEVGSAVTSVTTLALTNEAADVAAGTPTVTLSMDSDGIVLRSSFTANLKLLGYGAISFVDAVENLRVVETLLNEAGLAVPVGTVTMPSSKSQYAVYASDGINLEREQYTFSGTQDQNGETYNWSSQLVYDYTQANATGNLANTVRMVTITIAVQE